MITIIYDTIKGETITGELNGGYIVDGVKGKLDDNQVELEVIKTPEPDYDANTQNLTSVWKMEGKQYILEHTVTDKTPEELQEQKIAATPKEITKRQMLLFMYSQMGVTNYQIKNMINEIVDQTQRELLAIEWEFATVVDRSNPNVIAFAGMLGINETQLIDIFHAAKDI